VKEGRGGEDMREVIGGGREEIGRDMIGDVSRGNGLVSSDVLDVGAQVV
jgi:hypothetical protein